MLPPPTGWPASVGAGERQGPFAPPSTLPARAGLRGGARTACWVCSDCLPAAYSSRRPNPRLAWGPGGDGGAWQLGIWMLGWRLPRPAPPPGVWPRRGTYLDSFGQPSSFPACPALWSRPRVPLPDFAIGGGPAAGAPGNASCSRRLRWVSPAASELRERGPRRATRPSPMGRGRAGPGGQCWGGTGAPAPQPPKGRGASAPPWLCWGRGTRAAQPWHPQVGESWSCVPGSPARRARGRWGSLPRSWVLGWVFWVARQGEGGRLGSVLSLRMGGREGEKDGERRRETYPSLYKDTPTEKLILKHTEYTKRQKQKETRIQTDYGERQQTLRENPYTLGETHSDA